MAVMSVGKDSACVQKVAEAPLVKPITIAAQHISPETIDSDLQHKLDWWFFPPRWLG